MIRAILISCILTIGIKATFAAASFAADMNAARVAVLNQGAQ